MICCVPRQKVNRRVTCGRDVATANSFLPATGGLGAGRIVIPRQPGKVERTDEIGRGGHPFRPGERG